MANGTVRGWQKTGFAFGWKATSKLYSEITQFWPEKVRKLQAELLAGLIQCTIGLVVLQNGMYITIAGDAPWFS